MEWPPPVRVIDADGNELTLEHGQWDAGLVCAWCGGVSITGDGAKPAEDVFDELDQLHQERCAYARRPGERFDQPHVPLIWDRAWMDDLVHPSFLDRLLDRWQTRRRRRG